MKESKVYDVDVRPGGTVRNGAGRSGGTGRTPTKKKKKKKGSPMWAKLCLVFGVLLMLGSFGTLVGGKLVLDHYTADITHEGGLGEVAAEGKNIDGAINLLLVGVDERPTATDIGVRADSIIIAHVPVSHDAVYLTSIPRDTKVNIPAHKSTKWNGGVDKLNAAFQFGYMNGGGREGGLELLASTVSKIAGGIKFNGAAIVNFDGFQGIVKAIGGVDMCVDEKVTSIHIGWNSKTGKEGVPYVIHDDGTPGALKKDMKPQTYEVGCRHFAAWEALDYVRQRDLLANGDADYGRQRHQQQFIKAMLSKTTSSGVITNPIKVKNVLDSVGQAVTFYNNDVPLTDWIFTLKGITPDKMVTLKLNGGSFHSETIDGKSYETLDENSLALLQALSKDDLANYVQLHPEVINNDASTPATKNK